MNSAARAIPVVPPRLAFRLLRETGLFLSAARRNAKAEGSAHHREAIMNFRITKFMKYEI